MTKELSRTDRYLSIWILIAMVFGLGLAKLFPSVPVAIDSLRVGTTSVPLAIGLFAMMVPPLAKVRFERLGDIFRDRKVFLLSIFQNWLLAPSLMFALAIIFLGDRPEAMLGMILIGIAPCIAMVLVWNEMADGNKEYCAGLVAFNSLFQVLFFPVYAYFFATLLPGWLGLASADVHISIAEVAQSVFIYLGLPFLSGFAIRKIGIAKKGELWFESAFLPRFGKLTLGALLFTVVVMFSLQGEAILSKPFDALQIGVAMLAYFAIMFVLSLLLSWNRRVDYSKAATLAFTGASNNFELAIAVTIATFGIRSEAAFAAVIGPLVEVPVLIALVFAMRWMKPRWAFSRESDVEGEVHA